MTVRPVGLVVSRGREAPRIFRTTPHSSPRRVHQRCSNPTPPVKHRELSSPRPPRSQRALSPFQPDGQGLASARRGGRGGSGQSVTGGQVTPVGGRLTGRGRAVSRRRSSWQGVRRVCRTRRYRGVLSVFHQQVEVDDGLGGQPRHRRGAHMLDTDDGASQSGLRVRRRGPDSQAQNNQPRRPPRRRGGDPRSLRTLRR